MPTRTIRVSPDIYIELESLMQPRQSFGDVVRHLLDQHYAQHKEFKKYRAFMEGHGHGFTPPIHQEVVLPLDNHV